MRARSSGEVSTAFTSNLIITTLAFNTQGGNHVWIIWLKTPFLRLHWEHPEPPTTAFHHHSIGKAIAHQNQPNQRPLPIPQIHLPQQRMKKLNERWGFCLWVLKIILINEGRNIQHVSFFNMFKRHMGWGFLEIFTKFPSLSFCIFFFFFVFSFRLGRNWGLLVCYWEYFVSRRLWGLF